MNSRSVGGFCSKPSFLHQHPDVVTGAAHQNGFDLVVTQNGSGEGPSPGNTGRWQ